MPGVGFNTDSITLHAIGPIKTFGRGVFDNEWMIIVSPAKIFFRSDVFVFRLTISNLIAFSL